MYDGNIREDEYIDEATEQLLAEYEERERKQFENNLATISNLSCVFGYDWVDEFLRLSER